MTAREEYQAIEARLVAIEQQLVALDRYDADWDRFERGRLTKMPVHPSGHRQELTLERSQLEEKSFRLWQRMRAEAPA